MEKAIERPEWIRGKVFWSSGHGSVTSLLNELGVNSVCEEAACPNKGECWSKKHVTFMILGETCTRDCRFCNVTGGIPETVDPLEPRNIALAVKKLDIKYVVITSVTRDDLKDRGAGHFAETVREIKALALDVRVELLIPDLDARAELLKIISSSGAEVIGHNIEMPRALYPDVRPGSNYERSLNSLDILNKLKNNGADILVKSGMMIGLGEKEEDILRTLKDLKTLGVDIVYIGQYLCPSALHSPVKKYYSPSEFEFFKEQAFSMGFGTVLSGPMVRTSYKAHRSYNNAKGLVPNVCH